MNIREPVAGGSVAEPGGHLSGFGKRRDPGGRGGRTAERGR